MARKKRAWNMSNPLYRYLHSGKKSRKSKGGYVARRKSRGFRKGKRSLLGGGILSHGLAPKIGTGIMALAISAGIGYLAVKYVNPKLPQVIPMQPLAVATAAGGLPGLVGGFVAGGMSTGTSGSSGGYL